MSASVPRNEAKDGPFGPALTRSFLLGPPSPSESQSAPGPLAPLRAVPQPVASLRPLPERLAGLVANQERVLEARRAEAERRARDLESARVALRAAEFALEELRRRLDSGRDSGPDSGS